MTNLPEIIWAYEGDDRVEYVRADIVTARVDAESEPQWQDGYNSARDDLDAEIAHISAREAKLAEMTIRIKPLEWKALANTETEVGFGGGRSEYTVIPTKNAWRAYGIPGESDGGTEFFTKDAAKAAAQADYERRIRLALVGVSE